MASEIRGFADPSSLQAFEGLVGQEQFNRQMGLAGMQNLQNQQLAQQQMGLQQQELAQRGALEQQRLAQQQGQFEAGLLEAQRERSFRTSERMGEQDFQRQQFEALQRWEQQKTNELRAYELQLEEIALEEQEARSKGQTAALANIAARKQALQIEQAKKSMEIAQAQMIAGQSQESAMRMLSEFRSKLEQQIGATQAAQNNGSNFAQALVNAMSEDSRSAATAAIGNLRQSQFKGLFSQSGKELSEDLTAATLGDLPGIEFLITAPDFLATLKSLSPGQTPSAALVQGEVDPADMTRMLQDRLSKSAIGVARSFGLKDETAFREALMLATGGGNKAEVMNKMIASGVDPTTARSLFARAAEQIETEGMARIQSLSERARAQSGGQDSLAIRALGQERKAQSSLASMLRGAASKIDVADTVSLEAGINHLRDIIERGELSSLSQGTLRRALGPDSGDIAPLISMIGRGRGAAQQAAFASEELGNLAEQGLTNQDLDVLEMLAAEQAGTSARRSAIGRIRKGLSP